MCFNVSMSISLSLYFFLSSEPLGPGSPKLVHLFCTAVVNGNPSHCCGCLPGRVCAPAVHSATRWAPKIGVFLTPSLASWSYFCSVRATPFTFRATRKTEREKHSFFSFSQNDNTNVLCVGAAVLFLTQILFTPHAKPRCC